MEDAGRDHDKEFGQRTAMEGERQGQSREDLGLDGLRAIELGSHLLVLTKHLLVTDFSLLGGFASYSFGCACVIDSPRLLLP
jgi:hypothetical protein